MEFVTVRASKGIMENMYYWCNVLMERDITARKDVCLFSHGTFIESPSSPAKLARMETYKWSYFMTGEYFYYRVY